MMARWSPSEATYLRPIALAGRAAADVRAYSLAGTPARFAEVEAIRRGATGREAARVALDAEALERLTAPRPPIAGRALDRPLVMGIVNVTPDSFSDGGRLGSVAAAVEAGLAMVDAGADILDVGGESTRPGARPVALELELERVSPVIEGLVAAGCSAPISIDTRKAVVARAAFAAGARIFNDVSALTWDPDSLATAGALCGGAAGGWVVLTHSQGEPETMQRDPRYDDAPLDVYDALAARLAAAEAAGVPRDRLIIDPGLGFGKTITHNMSLMVDLTVFHALGAPVMVGASRKGMIGKLSGEPDVARRAPGSVSAALWAATQAAHILRAHDVRATAQALKVWRAFAEMG